jgi:2-succinyl-5-enolpyruvyl-6-hydroxy-3-cyclohexene-1-carboxylate synthase
VTLLEAGPRTVVVAGDGAGWEARWVAEAASWPLLAEPSSGARSGPNALAAYRLLLDRLGPEIERVVVCGRPTLSRPVTKLLSRGDVELVVVPRRGRVVDLSPTRPSVAEAVAPAWVDKAAQRAQPDDWLLGWLRTDSCARRAMAEVLDDTLTGPSVARLVAATLPAHGLLVAGSSSAVRDLDLAEPWDEPLLGPDGAVRPAEHRRVLANRGASGIDGTVSTAVGAALVHDGPAYALMGDLTFLHDSTGLVIGPDEPRPDLTIVVVNDDGGGLFTLLEQGAPEHGDVFERVFGTPHGVDLAALAAATGTTYARVDSLDALRAELEPKPGLRVVEVRIDRRGTRDLHARLRSAVTAALA